MNKIIVATWNVNSIRQRIQQVIELIKQKNIDVLMLQEIKCLEKDYPEIEIADAGYNSYLVGQKTFNGVAIIAKKTMNNVKVVQFGDDDTQARYIEADYEQKQYIKFASVYVPNGQDILSDKFIYKKKFFADLTQYIKNLRKDYDNLILAGDFNVAPQNIDVFDPKALNNTICFSQNEKKWFYNLINQTKLYDTYRELYPNQQDFTWWNYKASAFKFNKGYRIDHILASAQMMDKLHKVYVELGVRAKTKASDHAPVIAEFHL